MREARVASNATGDGRDAQEENRSPGSPGEKGEPRKRHGDALKEGTGTRHGVQERDERPATEERPD